MAEGGARAPVAPPRHHHQQPPPAAARAGPVPSSLRALVLRRAEGHGFGFTLRHLIVYPPESYSDLYYDGRHAAVGAVSEPMDTIFVKSVRDGGAAQRAGVRTGDRLVAVDGQCVAGWPYARVVHLIQHAPRALRLHVVPKEHDVLQKYFSEAAYNPETNQRPHSRTRERRISAGEQPQARDMPAPGLTGAHPLYTHPALHCRPIDPSNVKPPPDRSYAGGEAAGGVTPRGPETRPQAALTAEARAARRASEGARLPVDPYPYCASPPSSPFDTSRDSASAYTSGESIPDSYRSRASLAKGMPLPLSQPGRARMPTNGKLVQYGSNPDSIPTQYATRFDPIEDRRESDASLTSSAADSKDSLSSFESISTLTGHETDDSIFLSRIRKSLEQKEAFLRRPSQPTGWVTPEDHSAAVIQQREFYARPQKLHKPVWPPLGPGDRSPLRAEESSQDGVSVSVADINADRESGNHSAEQTGDLTSGALKMDKSASKQKHDKAFVSTLSKISENTPNESNGSITNGSPASPGSLETMPQDKRYPIPSELQIVSNRMRQFESPQPLEDRTALYRSELARLSTKKPEPTVALRRKEFESRGGKRDAKSLESQQSLEEAEMNAADLSGNRLMLTGGKHLTCPPPEGYSPESERILVRMRSNSTGSEGLPTRRTHASDGSYVKRRFALSKEQMEALVQPEKENESTDENNRNGRVPPRPESLCDSKQVPNGFNNISADYYDNDKTFNKNNHNAVNAQVPVRPEPTVSPSLKRQPETLASALPEKSFMHDSLRISASEKRAERPTQLSLAPGRLLFPGKLSPPTTPSSPQSPSGMSMDDGVVIRRQKNAVHLGAEEERAMRRVSYLKATWGDRLPLESDHELSDTENQVLRSDKKEREEFTHDAGPAVSEDLEVADISMQGSVQVKMVLTNGKRASDRSWKQAWAVLQGPKLTLYRHQHQSPTAGGSSESLNLRFSMADVAGDYTKRKHVVRVTSIAGAELLLQAPSAADAARWLSALRAQTPDRGAAPASPAESAGPTSPPPAGTASPAEISTASLTASPKSKTWKGRVARQLRRMQAGGGPGAAAPGSGPGAGGAVGTALERCAGLEGRALVPQLVGLCTRAVEERGLHVVGVYRVPGNTASVTALRESLERGQPPDPRDPRWTDVNVVSSLLKAFFRCLPDPLLTKELYPMFIAADKLADGSARVHTIRRLVRGLPDHHYETLKFLMEHLKRVVAESSVNKMEARNLAIVFGPTLVRSADDNMLTMVNDMSSQCRIIESLINHMEWYFDEEDRSSPLTDVMCEEELPSTTPNQALLLQNVKKIEGKIDVSTKDIVSSIISAANRKIQRKPRSKTHSANNECGSPVHAKEREPRAAGPPPARLAGEPCAPPAAPAPAPAPAPPDTDNYPIKTYTGLDQTTQERVKKFEMEIRAVLRREKRRDQSSDWQNNVRQETASPSLSGHSVTGTESSDSADFIGRANAYFNKSNNINEANSSTGKRLKTDTNASGESFNEGMVDMVSSLTSTFDQKLRSLHSSSPLPDQTIPLVDESHDDSQDFGDPSLHRPSEISASQDESNSKHLEDGYKTEPDCIDGSPHDEESPKLSMDKNSFETLQLEDKENTKPLNNLQHKNSQFIKSIENESDSEKDVDITTAQCSPDNVTPNNDRNVEKFSFRKSFHEKTKNSPEHKISDPVNKNALQDIFFKKGALNLEVSESLNVSLLMKNKLKRSESLNRETEKQIIKNNKMIMSENFSNKNEASDSGIDIEKPNSPKLRRSVSLNRSDVKLKRSDSLTKNEKTETNLIKRREIYYGGLNRASAKLKRKNGMPERSIKRRHTVGGTKDFDKDEWVALGCSRTSSPDLPTTLTDLQPHPAHVSPVPLESHV